MHLSSQSSLDSPAGDSIFWIRGFEDSRSLDGTSPSKLHRLNRSNVLPERILSEDLITAGRMKRLLPLLSFRYIGG